MRKPVLFPLTIFVLFLVACSDSDPQTEDVSMDNASDQPFVEDDPEQELSAAYVTYFYFIESDGSDLPRGSVVVLPDILTLAPTESGIIRADDPAADIRFALGAMMDDPHNEWTSSDLVISEVTYDGGHADVILQGDVSGAGDIVLIAFRMQVLMTVFADASVQTATITLNGECIGNLGISHESEARPADYVYNREEIETF